MRQKRKTYRMWLLLGLIPVILVLFCFYHTVRPMVRELARSVVANQASCIIHEAVDEQLQTGDIDYNSMVLLEKDTHGDVTALKTNFSEINRLKAQILSVVDKRLLDLDVNEIGLPLGSIILPEFFSGTGVKLPVRVLSVSSSDAKFHNAFYEAGINQTSHQIIMDVSMTVTVLTPVGTEPVEVSSQVLVAETVIVGRVPSSYVDLK